MRDERGFTLVGLMVAVAVVNIALGVAVSSWVTIGRRADEAEAIFRGRQIARALECFRAQESRAPEKLEELVEAGCLRRLWPDPFSRDGQWRPLTEQDLADGTVAGLLGTAPPAGSGEVDSSGFATSEQSTQQGIVGVASGARGPSLRHYNGLFEYERWVFLADTGS